MDITQNYHFILLFLDKSQFDPIEHVTLKKNVIKMNSHSSIIDSIRKLGSSEIALKKLVNYEKQCDRYLKCIIEKNFYFEKLILFQLKHNE